MEGGNSEGRKGLRRNSDGTQKELRGNLAGRNLEVTWTEGKNEKELGRKEFVRKKGIQREF